MNNLKKQREKVGLTQQAVADVLNLRQTTVSMWETGDSLPRADLLLKIAELYGCTVDELLRDECQPPEGITT